MPAYDLLIKGGHVIDAANDIDAQMDLAIAGRVVAAVEPEIPESPFPHSFQVPRRSQNPTFLQNEKMVHSG